MSNHEPRGWIQWKGTNVCMDVHCQCGKSDHVGEFVYFYRCKHCGQVYKCDPNIKLIPVSEDDEELSDQMDEVKL